MGSAEAKKRSSRGAETPEEGPKTATRRLSSGGKPEINPELRDRLTTELRGQLKDYIGARREAWNRSQPAQAAIIAAFLQDELNLPGVDQHDLYTVYTVMGERSPGNLRSQLTNARQRSRFFSGATGGKLMLSHAGENFARFDSLSQDGEE